MFDNEGDELEKYDNPLQIKFQLMHAYKLKILRTGIDRLERIQYFHKLAVLMSDESLKDVEDNAFNFDMDHTRIRQQLSVQYSQHDDLHMEMNNIILHSTDKQLIEAVLRLVVSAGPENAESLFLNEEDDNDFIVRLSQFIMAASSSESFISFSCMALSYAIPVVDNDTVVSEELIHFVMNRLKSCIARYPVSMMSMIQEEVVVPEGTSLIDQDETYELVVSSCSSVVDAERPPLESLHMKRGGLVEFLLISSIWLLTEVSANHAILSPFLQENGLDVIFYLLKYKSYKTLTKTIDWITRLAVHQKFSSVFLSRGGLTVLVRLPFWRNGDVQVPASDLSLALCSIARSPAIQEQICLLSEVEQLDLLRCSMWCFDAHAFEATRAILNFLMRMMSYRTFTDLFTRENYLNKLIEYLRENRKQLNSSSAQKYGGPALLAMIYEYFASVIVNTYGNSTLDIKYTPTPRYRQTKSEYTILDPIITHILSHNCSAPSIILEFIQVGATQDILDLISTHSSRNQNSFFKEMVYNGLQILWLISAFRVGQEDLIVRDTVIPKTHEKDDKEFSFFNNRSVFVSGTHFLFDLNREDGVVGFFPDESIGNASQSTRHLHHHNNHDVITIINQYDPTSNVDDREEDANIVLPDVLDRASSPASRGVYEEGQELNDSHIDMQVGSFDDSNPAQIYEDRAPSSDDGANSQVLHEHQNSDSSIPIDFLDFIIKLIIPPKDRQVYSDDPIMVALFVLLNFCFVDSAARKQRTSTPKKSEHTEIFRKTLKTIRARNALSILVNLLKFHHVEHPEDGSSTGIIMASEWNCIRIIVCRLLLALNSDNAVKQVLSNRIGKLVPELLREPSLPCADAELHKLFRQLLGQLYHEFTGFALSMHISGPKALSKAERRAIAANTQIRYSSAELLELIAQHLHERGFVRTSAALTDEAADASIHIHLDAPATDSAINDDSHDKRHFDDDSHMKRHFDDDSHTKQQQRPFTLDSIIRQFLYDQHMKCDRPAQVIPDFSLRYPHVCHTYSGERLASKAIPTNVSRRWYHGQLNGHVPFSAPRRYFQYSQFSRNFGFDWEGSGLLSVVYRSNNELLLGSNVGTVSQWDIENSVLLHEWECSSHAINRLVYNASTNCVLTPGDRKDSMLWDLDHMEHGSTQVRVPCCECSISRDGSQIVGLSSKRILLWDVEGQREITSLYKNPSSTRPPQFSPDDALVLQMATLWDKRQHTPLHRFDLFTSDGSEAFHPNGLEVVIHSEVWDLRSFKLLKSCPSLDRSQLLFGHRGEFLLACKKFTDRQPRSARMDRLQLLDAFSYDVVSAWSFDNEQCTIAIHPEDTQFVVVCHDRWRIWDMRNSNGGPFDDEDNVSDRLDDNEDDESFDSENDEFSDLLDDNHDNSILSYSDDMEENNQIDNNNSNNNDNDNSYNNNNYYNDNLMLYNNNNQIDIDFTIQSNSDGYNNIRSRRSINNRSNRPSHNYQTRQSLREGTDSRPSS